jgi:DNA-binding NarL/FixJ family response regulator
VTRVLIVDDQALVRAGFSMLIDSEPDLETVGMAADGAQGVAMVDDCKPDVVLMDIRMPVMDGIEATQQILARPHVPPVRVVVLTTFDIDEYVFRALKAGASGFLLKDTPPPDLLNGIRVVAAGDALLSPSITRQLIREFVRRDEPKEQCLPPLLLPNLTERELEVLALVARGLSNYEIGLRLHISPATAKTHVGRLLTKLDVRDRTQLIIAAYESDVVVAHKPDFLGP